MLAGLPRRGFARRVLSERNASEEGIEGGQDGCSQARKGLKEAERAAGEVAAVTRSAYNSACNSLRRPVNCVWPQVACRLAAGRVGRRLGLFGGCRPRAGAASRGAFQRTRRRTGPRVTSLSTWQSLDCRDIQKGPESHPISWVTPDIGAERRLTRRRVGPPTQDAADPRPVLEVADLNV